MSILWRSVRMVKHSQVEVMTIPSVYGMFLLVSTFGRSMDIPEMSNLSYLRMMAVCSRVGVLMERYFYGTSLLQMTQNS